MESRLRDWSKKIGLGVVSILLLMNFQNCSNYQETNLTDADSGASLSPDASGEVFVTESTRTNGFVANSCETMMTISGDCSFGEYSSHIIELRAFEKARPAIASRQSRAPVLLKDISQGECSGADCFAVNQVCENGRFSIKFGIVQHPQGLRKPYSEQPSLVSADFDFQLSMKVYQDGNLIDLGEASRVFNVRVAQLAPPNMTQILFGFRSQIVAPAPAANGVLDPALQQNVIGFRSQHIVDDLVRSCF